VLMLKLVCLWRARAVLLRARPRGIYAARKISIWKFQEGRGFGGRPRRGPSPPRPADFGYVDVPHHDARGRSRARPWFRHRRVAADQPDVGPMGLLSRRTSRKPEDIKGKDPSPSRPERIFSMTADLAAVSEEDRPQ